MAHVKPKTKVVKVPIYDRELIITDDGEAAERLLTRRYGVYMDLSARATCVGMTCMIDCIGVVVLIVGDKSPRTLCHESVHAAWEILRYVGVDSDIDNQEPLAYLTDWIFNEGMKVLKL